VMGAGCWDHLMGRWANPGIRDERSSIVFVTLLVPCFICRQGHTYIRGAVPSATALCCEISCPDSTNPFVRRLSGMASQDALHLLSCCTPLLAPSRTALLLGLELAPCLQLSTTWVSSCSAPLKYLESLPSCAAGQLNL
jgi:hypothetical protein